MEWPHLVFRVGRKLPWIDIGEFWHQDAGNKKLRGILTSSLTQMSSLVCLNLIDIQSVIRQKTSWPKRRFHASFCLSGWFLFSWQKGLAFWTFCSLRSIEATRSCEGSVGRSVDKNIHETHMLPFFIPKAKITVLGSDMGFTPICLRLWVPCLKLA